MRPLTFALLAALALGGTAGSALADGEFTPSKRVTPLPGGHFLCDVAFPYDGVAVSGAGSVELDQAAAAMKTDVDALVVLDAYTDRVGDTLYNTGLAQRRAEIVRDGLVARGIDPDRIVMAIYGERTIDGKSTPADRRVDLWMTYTVSIQEIVDRTLPRGEAVVWTRPLTPSEIAHKPRLIADRSKAKANAKAKPARRSTSTGLTALR